MMKRMISILLIMLLACSSACGNNGVNNYIQHLESEMQGSDIGKDDTNKNENSEELNEVENNQTEHTEDSSKDSDTQKQNIQEQNTQKQDTREQDTKGQDTKEQDSKNPTTEKKEESFTIEENTLADGVIATIIDSSMGEFAKVKAIHDYLLINVDYDYENYLNGTIPNVSHTAKGALANGYAVCDGYAHAFQLLCQKAGIPCEFVTGTSKGEPHAWNQVKIEGNWYNIDVTWDDPPVINGEMIPFDDHRGNSYEYFCIPDSLMYQDHETTTAPFICTEPALYERALMMGSPWDNTIYVASAQELIDFIKIEIQKGNYIPEFYIKESTITGKIEEFLMDCVFKTGVFFRGIGLSYFTYFEGTVDPGTYYKITLSIQR